MFERRIAWVPLLVVCLSLCSPRGVHAADAADAKDANLPKTSKPIQLFNGKDFTGWTAYSSDPKLKLEDVWSVKDGVIHCKGKPAGYIRTEKDYTSFVLRFEWRTLKAGNSGCLIRVQPPDKIWPKSIECQLMTDNAGDIWVIDEFPIKVIPPTRRNGRHITKLQPSSEKPLGEWNQYEITADGTNLKLRVNGVVQSIASDVQVIPGKILLQSEGAEMEFRNIELAPIEDAPADAKPQSSAEASEMKRLDGLEGWHITGVGHWTYKDGIIEGQQGKDTKTYTHVVSDKSYKDFKATVKYKAIQGNSGFYFRVLIDDTGNAHGFQAEIDEKRDAGGLYESAGRGWVSQPKAEDTAKYFKPQEWNEMTIEAKGPHVLVTVNGAKAAEINDPSVRMEGPFALQIHGGQDVHVQFKDIVIEPLPE